MDHDYSSFFLFLSSCNMIIPHACPSEILTEIKLLSATAKRPNEPDTFRDDNNLTLTNVNRTSVNK